MITYALTKVYPCGCERVLHTRDFVRQCAEHLDPPPCGMGLALVALWKAEFLKGGYHMHGQYRRDMYECGICAGRVTLNAIRWLRRTRGESND